MRGLWHSTPLRLSIGIVALFAIVSFASFAASYIVARDASEATLQETLRQEMLGLRATPSRAALVSLVRSQSRATAPERRILSYRLPGGIVVGNAALIADGEGFRAISIRDRGEIEGSFYALSEVVHGGLLTVAVNADRVDGVRQAFVSVFLFSLIPTTVIVLGGGLWLARRSGRRLARLEAVLDALAEGDYTARVEAGTGRNDDLSRIGARINRMAEAQERQVNALRQASADIAHDLKTPIQRVSVILEKLLNTKGLPDDAQDLAETALIETRNVGQVFSALLQIARLEDGAPNVEMEPVDLGALLETLHEVFEPSAEEARQRLTIDLPPDPVLAKGNRTLLGQAITNLIENALRHAGPEAAITLSCGQTKEGVYVEVADTGPGIPEEERGNVVRRLYRLERSRTTPGSGLGLSLVAAIADLHGGELLLSDNAPGLRARLRLPVA